MSLGARAAAWAAASLATAALDLLWLGVLARDLYRRELGHLMAERVAWPAAALFYALYGWGALRFAAAPAAREGGLPAALSQGALLGLLAYGTYDLTNRAVLRGWGWGISAVDVAWGVFITAAASAAAYGALRLFPR